MIPCTRWCSLVGAWILDGKALRPTLSSFCLRCHCVSCVGKAQLLDLAVYDCGRWQCEERWECWNTRSECVA